MAFLDVDTNGWDFVPAEAKEGFEEYTGAYKAVITEAFGSESKKGAKYVHLDLDLFDPRTGEEVGRKGFDLYLTNKEGKSTFEFEANGKKIVRKLPAWNTLATIVAKAYGIEEEYEIKNKVAQLLTNTVDAAKTVYGEQKVVAGIPELAGKKFTAGLVLAYNDYNDSFKSDLKYVEDFDCDEKCLEKLEKAIKRANEREAKKAEKQKPTSSYKENNTNKDDDLSDSPF